MPHKAWGRKVTFLILSYSTAPPPSTQPFAPQCLLQPCRSCPRSRISRVPQPVGLNGLLLSLLTLMPRKDVLKALDTHLAALSLARLGEKSGESMAHPLLCHPFDCAVSVAISPVAEG